MKKSLVLFCLTLTILLGSAGMSASADFQKGTAAYKSGDYATALREWEPLAKQGNADAMFNLGTMYRKGEGVPKNYKTAVQWYRIAAWWGHASAQGGLGAMYAFGAGVKKDYARAYMWGNIAATNGNKKAAKWRDVIEKKMTPAEIAEAQKLTHEYCKKTKGC